ncbi:ABC transporter ATP-binding protein [Gorillibacterium timonense]|uniref:ABC transporter ATP-binding protein n=1 Tax=Gorillibacterium timonense TaxID=1689269 RepID=UPI00071DB911|nr:ABC transporter ATP-binding protein [Gorillibacterium timonense]
METIIELDKVSKTFQGKKAVNGISFRIDQGEIVAILGPNGAGKTTTLSMLLGLLRPTEGTIRLFGHEPGKREVRERIGAMLQEVSVMDRLRVHELISLIRSYYPHPLTLEELTTITGLAKTDLNRYAEKLSGGQKRNLGFALALAGDPDLLFFDEPTVGLDITARRRFWEQARRLADQGKTIVFTTHYLQEADDFAKRILLFNQGELIADGTPEEIKSRILKQSVSFHSNEDNPELRAKLAALPEIDDCYFKEGRITVTTDNTDKALTALILGRFPIHDIRIDSGRLDEAFEQLTHIAEEN